MTVLTRHSALRGLIAPVVALGAAFVAALFLTTSSDSGGITLLVWSLAACLPVLGLANSRRFRDRPAVGAGLAGVVTWVALLATFAVLRVESDFFVILWLVSGVVVAGTAGVVAERPTVLRDTALPSNLVRGLTLAGIAASIAAASAIACPAAAPTVVAPRAVGERIGRVEIPALPTVVRERFTRPGHREQIEVEVTSVAQPGGGASASVAILRDDTDGVLAPRSDTPCVLDVPPTGRTIEILASDDAYEVRWPVSPHTEVYGGCTYELRSLRTTDDNVRTETSVIPWALVVAPFYGLLALGLAFRLRRGHARIDRSPEVRVNEPGLAVMPDGSPALVSSEIPMGTTIVALRLADVRPDYRSDARLSIEEHAIGEKAALLVDLARRVRTLELVALGGVAVFLSLVAGAWAGGAPLGF